MALRCHLHHRSGCGRERLCRFIACTLGQEALCSHLRPTPHDTVLHGRVGVNRVDVCGRTAAPWNWFLLHHHDACGCDACPHGNSCARTSMCPVGSRCTTIAIHNTVCRCAKGVTGECPRSADVHRFMPGASVLHRLYSAVPGTVWPGPWTLAVAPCTRQPPGQTPSPEPGVSGGVAGAVCSAKDAGQSTRTAKHVCSMRNDVVQLDEEPSTYHSSTFHMPDVIVRQRAVKIWRWDNSPSIERNYNCAAWHGSH